MPYPPVNSLQISSPYEISRTNIFLLCFALVCDNIIEFYSSLYLSVLDFHFLPLIKITIYCSVEPSLQLTSTFCTAWTKVNVSSTVNSKITSRTFFIYVYDNSRVILELLVFLQVSFTSLVSKRSLRLWLYFEINLKPIGLY